MADEMGERKRNTCRVLSRSEERCGGEARWEARQGRAASSEFSGGESRD